MAKFLWTYLFLNCIGAISFAQKVSLKVMDAPDSIYYKLACKLAEKPELKNAEDSVYLSMTIQNLEKIKDYRFKKGLFSYRFHSPHASRKMFLFLGNELYIFKSDEFDEIIIEYLAFSSRNKLKVPEKSKYLSLISKFLSEEYAKQ